MIEFGHEMLLLGIGLILAFIGWSLKKEHNRIEANEDSLTDLNSRLSRAITEIDKNSVADVEWRKRVEENHHALLKADEDRRGDARKIYDKIEILKGEFHAEISRLGEKVAKK